MMKRKKGGSGVQKNDRVYGNILAIFLLAVFTLACLLASCAKDPPSASSDETTEATTETTSDESGEETGEESGDVSIEESLPPPEAIVLLYTDYLTVQTEQDGLRYQYTYCFDEEERVFNAVAVIDFRTEEDARREYVSLRKRGYPNLELDGTSLSFCFPRRECPFYGISYRSLEFILEDETVYEIIDRHYEIEEN